MKRFVKVSILTGLVLAGGAVAPVSASNPDLARNCAATISCPVMVTGEITRTAASAGGRERAAVDIVVALGNEAMKLPVNAPECANLAAGIRAASDSIVDATRKSQARKIASTMCSIRRLTTASVEPTVLSRSASSN